ncbi:MAG TPA: XdhC family protein [Pseudacidobacterium sp.]|jgi:xanthine/CO dehydrogenase XdhC/CoxF family maturation factor|nr:XdhC family protein [Pseudacidobacterium sp.]
MSELKQIVDLWRLSKARGEEVCLATVVRTEGSSYRKPGARMLLTRSGQRAGTISGGCLEGEVTKKAWWLTENGPTIQRYSSFFDEDSPMPYGLGCGGVVYVLLERGAAVHAILDALQANLEERRAFVIITDIHVAKTLLVRSADGSTPFASHSGLENFIERAMREHCSFFAPGEHELFVEYVEPLTALAIFGAGDDAKPLSEFARKLGWHVTVADGRSSLVRPERFPAADKILALDYGSSAFLDGLDLDSEHAYVLMTHSYEQDRALLRKLLPLAPRYLGILGPSQRTLRLISEIANDVHLRQEECLALLHSPVGFDIGAHSPEGIALSIVAEIFAVLNGREGLSLKKRAHLLPIHA